MIQTRAALERSSTDALEADWLSRIATRYRNDPREGAETSRACEAEGEKRDFEPSMSWHSVQVHDVVGRVEAGQELPRPLLLVVY